jgi:hypothetical protein
MKKKFLFISIIVFFFLSGCAPVAHHPQYYWGNYSHALYKNKKDHTPESYQAYKNALADIVEKSKTSGLLVPPGIYAEYGFVLAQEGKSEEAQVYFNLEKEKYPESKIFVDRLISTLGKKGGSL